MIAPDRWDPMQDGPERVADVVKAPDGTVCDGVACTTVAVVSVSLNVGLPPGFWCALCWVGEAIRLHLRGYALRC